jgi:hypothetical protein
MTPPTAPMSILVHWWLSIPLMSTVCPDLNITRTSVQATPPLAPLSISDNDCPGEAQTRFWYYGPVQNPVRITVLKKYTGCPVQV